MLVACGSERVFAVDYGVITCPAWGGGTTGHGDITNAYVKANKEEDLELFLAVPHGMAA